MSFAVGGGCARSARAAILAWLGVLGALITLGVFVQSVHAQQDVWTYYTDLRRVTGIAVEGDSIWVANSGGVVQFKRPLAITSRNVPITPSNYRHYSAFDGLAANNAVAIAIDGKKNKWIAHGEVDAALSLIDSLGDVHLVRPRDGLLLKPGKKANTVFASGDSVLAGTESGLTLFVDGEVRLRLDADDGLPSDNVLSVTTVGEDIWIGTDLGLARLRNGALATFDTTDGLPSDSVLSLGYRALRNELWIGTLEGPAVLRGGEDTIRAVTTTGLDLPSPTCAPSVVGFAFPDTAVWIGTSGTAAGCGGPFRFEGIEWRRPRCGNGDFAENDNVGGITSSGRIVWVGLLRDGPWRYDPLALCPTPLGQSPPWASFTFSNSPTADYFGSIDIDGQGAVWLTGSTKRDRFILGEFSQATRYDGTRFTQYGQGSSQSGGFGFTSTIHDVVRVDSQNRKWFGFWAEDVYGLNIFRANNTTVDTIDINFHCPEMTGREPTTEIRFDSQGIVWTAWQFYGVSALDPETRQCVSWGRDEGFPADALNRPLANALQVDRQGRAWVGFARATGGAAAMVDTRGTLFDKTDDVIRVFTTGSGGLPSDLIHNVEVDSAGRVWFATEAGLAIFDPGDSTWIVHRATASSRLLNESIRSVAILSDGTALVGDAVGNVYTIQSDGRTFGTTYNITTVGFPNRRVNEIRYHPATGAIWFALWGGGLVRLDRSDEPPPAPPPSGVIAWPNPWITDDGADGVTLDHVPSGSGVWLYSLTGELVRQMNAASSDSTLFWDTKNDGGREVASGVYIFVVRRNGIDLDQGKIAIIR